jgi:hypothetical protein
MANALPDSRTPRRFTATRKRMAPTAIMTSCPRSDGSRLEEYCVADEIETATVST